MCNYNTVDTKLYAILGGTFDPIHYGHLHLANSLIKKLSLSKIIFMPNHIPPHRPQPKASAKQRVAMIKYAIENNALFAVDELELKKTTPSYTIETLKTIRKHITPEQPLAFIVGQDVLLTLSTWHQWQSLIDYCHLVICQRPGYHKDIREKQLLDWFTQHHTNKVSLLHQQPHGYIYPADIPVLSISATEIRQRCANGLQYNKLLPNAVHQYILQHHLYR